MPSAPAPLNGFGTPSVNARKDRVIARSRVRSASATLSTSLDGRSRLPKEETMDATAITAPGLERLSEELERLTTDGRREIAERLRHAAASAANSAENADYFAACTDQARLEQRIALLQRRLRAAEVVEPQLGNGRIDLGERVRVRDLDSGE